MDKNQYVSNFNVHIMLWIYSMWSGFKPFHLLSNIRLWDDILTDLPQMTNHLILLSISGLEAFLPFSFSLPSTSLIMCVMKWISKVSCCSHCRLSALYFYFVAVFILLYSMCVGTVKLLVPVRPSAGFCCLQPSVADWICQVKKQKWKRLFSVWISPALLLSSP